MSAPGARYARRVPPSPEVRLEPWTRAIRHLESHGLAPVVPARISGELYARYGIRVAAFSEVPWLRRDFGRCA